MRRPDGGSDWIVGLAIRHLGADSDCSTVIKECRSLCAGCPWRRRKQRVTALRVVLWSMLCAQAALAAAQNATISGTVTDVRLGEAIRGAPVYLIGLPRVAVTKEDGGFELRDVRAGTYILTVAVQGYAPASDTLEVFGTARITHDFRLEPDDAAGEDRAGQPGIRGQGNRLPHPAPAVSEVQRFPQFSTVCGCFKSANATLGEALRLRKQYGSLAQFHRDSEAVNQLDTLLKSWRTAQQVCLTRFGTKLLEDSWCNRPGDISDKRRELDSLGIAI